MNPLQLSIISSDNLMLSIEITFDLQTTICRVAQQMQGSGLLWRHSLEMQIFPLICSGRGYFCDFEECCRVRGQFCPMLQGSREQLREKHHFSMYSNIFFFVSPQLDFTFIHDNNYYSSVTRFDNEWIPDQKGSFSDRVTLKVLQNLEITKNFKIIDS